MVYKGRGEGKNSKDILWKDAFLSKVSKMLFKSSGRNGISNEYTTLKTAWATRGSDYTEIKSSSLEHHCEDQRTRGEVISYSMLSSGHFI